MFASGLGSLWCLLLLLEIFVFRDPEEMPEPALKDSPMAIFRVYLPHFSSYRLEVSATSL